MDETRTRRHPVSRCLVAPYRFNAGGISIPERGGPGLLPCFADERLVAGDDGTGTTTCKVHKFHKVDGINY